jgi:hypothetical protein
MKKFLYIICILFSVNLANSKIHIFYDFEFPNHKDLSCNLTFYKNGMYKIYLFNQFEGDRAELIDLSYGSYVIKKNDIYLYDNYNKYQMHFLIYKEEIIPLTGFKILVNRSFLKNKYIDPPDTPFEKEDFISIEYSKSNFNINHKGYNKLEYGTYGYDEDVHFIVFKNKKYQFKYENLIISEGKWERTGNELICYDSYLQHKFYLSIGEKFIVNRFLPNGLTDYVLYIKK